MKKKVLITGSCGYIGSELSRILHLSPNYELILIDNCIYGQEYNQNCSYFYQTNLKTFVENLMHRFENIHTVIHLSGLSNDPVADFDSNANMRYNYEDTKSLFDKCIQMKIPRFVYASSASVYGNDDHKEMQEQQCLETATSNYAKSKYESEKYIGVQSNCNGYNSIILRKGTLMGVSPRMRFDLVVQTMIKDAMTTGKINLYGGGENWRPMVAIYDIVHLYKHIIDMSDEKYMICANHRIFNVAHKNYRVSELGLEVAYILDNSYAVPCRVDANYSKSKDLRSYRLCTDNLELSLGYKCKTGLGPVIHDIVHWIRNSKENLEDPKFYNIKMIKEKSRWAKLLGVDYKL